MSNLLAERPVTRAAVPDAMQGRTLKLRWLEGPIRGESQEIRFHEDGTFGLSGHPASLRMPYSCFELAEEVQLVSLPSPAGYTLTMALNFNDRSTMGVATRADGWEPVRGHIELLN
ncbi:hypothetical protein LRH25_16390 [Ideonella azotifigens]|uniref:Uncharacterized protein n=1 Tax=Ideonella azotifigens TaxID=513160 RepID=A0ABN1JJX9_9BURK|nr:hypothetical protein [Ideonella azotifigens]MCD2341921.1 hypothetical protein [Ideonella azotifigens]